MATIFTDDMNSYSDGDVNGQGGWVNLNEGIFPFGPSTGIFQGALTYEGAKAAQVLLIGFTGGAISKTGTLTATGSIKMYVQADGAGGGFIVISETGNTGMIEVGVQSGTWGYYDSDNNFNSFGTFSVNTWQALQIEWRSSDHKVRFQVDSEGFSDWVDPFADWVSGFDTEQFYNQGPSFYIDNIGENAVTPAAATILGRPMFF